MGTLPGWFRFSHLALTILGGVYGIGITVALSGNVHGVFDFLLAVCVTAAYAYVTVAGIIFWRQPQRLRPLRWALGSQIPWISNPGVVYQFAAGLYGMVAFVASKTGDRYSAGFTTKFNLGSSCELQFFQDAPFILGINLVPLGALLLLNRLRRTAENPTSEPPSNPIDALTND